jgi:hypothetical protein
VIGTRGKDADTIREEAKAWIERESREISSLR